MLGQELVRVFGEDAQYSVLAWDREEIDVTDGERLMVSVMQADPAIILNAVAYNAVDRCETSDEEYTRAKLLNTFVPEKLAQISQKIGCILVHYSTDYVFDGASKTGYDEMALPQPLSRYGETKLGGEQAVRASGAQVYIIRLSRLFGKPASSAQGKRSFFDTMLEQGRRRATVEVVDNERSCFTYAPDLAQATWELIADEAPWGVYHLPNEGGVTWYEAAKELYAQAGLAVIVQPIAGTSVPRPARRPSDSVLLNTRRAPLRRYQEALRVYLDQGCSTS